MNDPRPDQNDLFISVFEQMITRDQKPEDVNQKLRDEIQEKLNGTPSTVSQDK